MKSGFSRDTCYNRKVTFCTFGGTMAESESPLLTLVAISEQLEPDPGKRASVLAKIKRFVDKESVISLLGGVRAGGKGYRYPQAAVDRLRVLVSSPMVTAANVDEYLKNQSMTGVPALEGKTE